MSQVSNIPSVETVHAGSNPAGVATVNAQDHEGLRVRIPSAPPSTTTELPSPGTPPEDARGFGGSGAPLPDGGFRCPHRGLGSCYPCFEAKAARALQRRALDDVHVAEQALADHYPCQDCDSNRRALGDGAQSMCLSAQRLYSNMLAARAKLGGFNPREFPNYRPQPELGVQEDVHAGGGAVGGHAGHVVENAAGGAVELALAEGEFPVLPGGGAAVDGALSGGDAFGLREVGDAGDGLGAKVGSQEGVAVGLGLPGGNGAAVVAATTEQEQGEGESAHRESSGATSYRQPDHSVSAGVLEMIDRYQDSAWRRLQAEVDAATPRPEPAQSATPAQAPELRTWSIHLTSNDPGLRPGYWRVEVKRGPFVVYVWAGAPSHLGAMSAAEEFIRHRDPAPAVVSCTTESAPAPAVEPNWEGDPLEAAFALDVPEGVRDVVLHELKRREEFWDRAHGDDDRGHCAIMKGEEDDFVCRLLSAFNGLRALVLLLLVGAFVVGCGDRPLSPDAGADAGADVMPPCPQPAGTTIVFVPCDDGTTAQCELRADGGSTVPACVIQGRTCVASCAPARGEVHQ